MKVAIGSRSVHYQTFSQTGPNAQLYGAAENYPVPDVVEARLQGNPWEPRYRVGAFSHLDEIYPTRLIERAEVPWMFKCSTVDIHYHFRGNRLSPTD